MADKFAARQSDNYKVISLLPDVCKTPSRKGVYIPFTVSIDLGGAAGVSDNVNFNDDGAFLYDQSDTVKVDGDEPGKGKGIKSGTVGAKAEPITSSCSVRINNKQLVREDDLFYMNNKNTLGKLTTSESGGGVHITDEGKIEGETWPPNLLDRLNELLKKGEAWVDKQKQDFTQSFSETVEQEFSGVIEESKKILNDPQAYAEDISETVVNAGEEALIEAKEIAAINAQRSAQLAKQFETDPAGAVTEIFNDAKDEAAALTEALGDTITEVGDDIDGWLSEFGDKFDNAWEIAKQGDIGKATGVLAGTTISASVELINPGKKVKAAGKVGGAMGRAAKKSAALKKKKMAASKKNGNNKGGKSKRDDDKKGDDDKEIKCKGQARKGDCGEYLIENHHGGKDFEPLNVIDKLKNKSGNGIDHAFKSKKGELLFVESKSSLKEIIETHAAPLSKKQKAGGEEYIDGRIEAMWDGLAGEGGPWASKEADKDFHDNLKELEEERENAKKITYKVCRIQLEHDPTGCYKQRVNKQGKPSPIGERVGKCKQKTGTKIYCTDWVPNPTKTKK